jgi:tetratricopeptide (TPR) repeat protein
MTNRLPNRNVGQGQGSDPHLTELRAREADRLADAGEALVRSGAITDAVRTLRDALNLVPKHVRACHLLACGLELLGRRAEATEAWLGVGVALEAHDQFEQAAATYGKVIERKPDCVRAFSKLGWVLMKLAQPKGAVRCFEAALAIDPGNEQLHKRLGCAALMANDEARGWREWGWNDGLLERHRFEQPAWDGSADALRNRTILVWAEFALGDTIQCLRYLPLLKDAGARVVVETQATLLPLVQYMPCVDQAVVSGAPLPAFDLHAPLFSLPAAFHGSRLGGGMPYLTVGDDLIAAWRERLAASASNAGQSGQSSLGTHSRTIGLAWSGSPTGSNARYRFTRLASFAPLADLPDTRFISLQLGPRAADLATPPPGLRVETLLDESCSGADTAALMMNLDLIVTIDSMIAHLAGALARPVWTVTWLSPAWWLWQVDGDRSLWYPTMRLFQQKRAGDWADVVARVRASLELFEERAHPALIA